MKHETLAFRGDSFRLVDQVCDGAASHAHPRR
jgi:hypothetical protein